MHLKNNIYKLICRQDLSAEECYKTLQEILLPGANPLQITAFLILLRAKPETPEEIQGFISALKNPEHTLKRPYKILDIAGTGADQAHTINISTGSAILAASCGIKIAKHGNRAVSSKAGSADVLEKLGINIHLNPDKIAESIDKIGIGFYYCPNFYPAMQSLKKLRQQLNLPTTFNLLGPLLNPVNPDYLILGVFKESLLALYARILQQTSSIQRAVVAHCNGLDEISCTGITTLYEISPKTIHYLKISPEEIGLSRCSLSDLKGGNAQENAALLLDTFQLKKTKKIQAISDTLILNTAVALYIYGYHNKISEAVSHAKENLYNKSALKTLKNWIEYSHD